MSTCGKCGFVVPAQRGDVLYCPRCGSWLQRADLPPASPPYDAGPALRSGHYRGKSINLRRLARHQRWAIWVIPLQVLILCVMLVPTRLGVGQGMYVAVSMVHLLIWALTIAAVVLLEVDLRTNPAMVVLAGIFAAAPCVNLVILLIVNRHATKALQQAGIKVGLFGASREAVEKASDPCACPGCGYNLTGNVSGFCPECGLELSHWSA
jgi:predicted Zn-ribbon and HTH transcriptional regulator